MVRRLVTGTCEGKAIIADDGPPPKGHAFTSIPGMSVSILWSTGSCPSEPSEDDGDAVTKATSYVPAPGETRVLIIDVPPDSVRQSTSFDPAAAAEEYRINLPDMAGNRHPHDPRLHKTTTVDYVIVLEGEIYLMLDGGEEALLRPQDVVIQNATMHAWSNRSESLVKLAVILVGVEPAKNADSIS